MKKIKKFIRQPEIFFRDYLNKKHPIRNIEQAIDESEEHIILQNSQHLESQESRLKLAPFAVDVVFTWVNNHDMAWQQRRQQRSQQATHSALYSNDEARFANHNELYYSLHSVQTFLPWVNHIYIVTDQQTPDWFQAAQYPKVSIIDHRQIIDEQYLPTFNSHVIEAHLHNIPNLSEHFIYFNDDVFVARPLLKEHFFRANGIASLFVANKSLKHMQSKGVQTPTLSASQNSMALLQHHHGCQIDNPLVHTYVPLRKSLFQAAWKLYADEIKAFLPNAFRSNHDLNLATFLVPWLMYLNGVATFSNDVCYYFNIRSNKAPAQYRKLLHQNAHHQQPHSFCANDFHSQQQIDNYHSKLIEMLRAYFQI
ncbi:Stealth CR1 domain-containing protein [Alysiella filiformis]|uniref:Stealth protein CR3, conserved region 3 n=1 Tax=Alysiella filiformis DSM 16848 TaxID=1120981 RepID=A0A286ECV3_9NEIS|nr:Stealth CR1 domain-containing protein [Alysiella filiformis]QMT31901.1 stealth conserved region 3 domain-containing protein [Alysiella filiformis]UBQ57193.1 Stealth CR1 domain-containing protein [Alysiella filiformis DSM 16848]SOD68723.1 Stealth protein CR3, conserved region 3 [Alysiella filiformis DSM 16848]